MLMIRQGLKEELTKVPSFSLNIPPGTVSAFDLVEPPEPPRRMIMSGWEGGDQATW